MEPQAIEQAKLRLQKAGRSLEALKVAQNYESAEEAWTDFLIAASGIYSKLEQGAKANGKSKAWYGRKKKERKDDPLLRYLHRARNSDEHGIERVAERGGNQRTPFGEPLKFNERREYTLTTKDPETGEMTHDPQKAWLYGPSLQMVRVHDRRYNDYCDPPMQHLGKHIELDDNSLIGKATLGLTYLTGLVAEAETFVTKP